MRDNSDPRTQQELLASFRHAPVRMPKTQADLFQLLATYNPQIGQPQIGQPQIGQPQIGWDAFAETIDFNNVTPRQVYQVVLGRHPGTIDQAVPGPDYDAKRHFREALVSREFRQRFVGAFLQAYRTKGRDVFIHIPKCAGTDLILNLGCRSVPLPKMLEIEGWTSDDSFLEIAAGLARAATTSERLFVYGHMELGGYIDLAGIRPDDCIFTVLRDPIDMMISQANYAIGRVRQDPTGQEPDAADYLRMLGLTRLPDPISIGDLKTLTVKALLDQSITETNRACFFLGRGSTTVFATALENLIIHNLEVTTTQHYDRWLSDRWGISISSHHNRSDPILSNIEARRLCGSALAAASAEDRKLYDIVSSALQQAGSASITGQQLARLFGPPLTEALSRNECPPLPVQSHPATTDHTILVAETAEYVEMYLTPVSVAGTAVIDTIVAAGFGADADGDRYRLTGWAAPEDGFTWTAASQSTIQLGPLTGAGSFIVRLVVTPFTVAELRPFQQVELLIEGACLGGCEVRSRSVIEAEIPAELLRANNRLTLTLRLPMATRPSEVSQSGDHRQLALAVSGMTILRIPPARA